MTKKTDRTRPTSRPRRKTKIDKVITLLRRKQGATLGELVKVTGWQPHTVRASLTGLKHKGHAIRRDKRDEATCYSIDVPASA
jgi:DNA-binding IclR family transcriptional regulator